MAKLSFRYRMKLLFDSPVTDHRFTIKCFPQSNDYQEVIWQNYEIYPNRFLCKEKDSFGNSCIYGYCEEEHSYFSIEVFGEVITGKSGALKEKDIVQCGYYKYNTPVTMPGKEIMKLYEGVSLKYAATNKEKTSIFMDILERCFIYQPGITQIETTAEEAMALGKGVCQDYAHILLSLCRLEKIPCRYVTGMLSGEGQSHAWIEIYEDGFWYSADPTNHCWIEEDHIKIAHGRDYSDCLINQGIFRGNANQIQEIMVVAEKEG